MSSKGGDAMKFPTIVFLIGAGALTWLLAGVAPARGEEEKQLTAREMFYAAPAAVKPPPQAKPPAPPKPKPEPQQAAAKPPVRIPAPEKVETAARPPEQTAKIVPVAYKARVPLGVRYAILKRADAQRTVEVDPEGVFRAGDRIRVSIEVNDGAYLYIVNRGSSGAWKVLFPSAEVQGGHNRVEPGRGYEIPPGYVFTFDEQPGVERLFLVLSRQPETDLESLIYKLSERPGAVTPAPPPEEKPAKMLLAQNLPPIEDSLIGRLRNTYARDLIIERVDEATPGPRKETAVYVVNTTWSTDSRVVVDIELNHQ